MKRTDMEVGTEYLISSERNWADRPIRYSTRARLLDTDKWTSLYMGTAGSETRPERTMSGVLELPQRLRRGGPYDRDVLIENLDRDTGETTGTYRAVPSADLRMSWEEGKALVEENTKVRDEENAKRRAARAEVDRRIEAFHQMFETEQGSRYGGGGDTVVISLEEAERIMDMFGRKS